MLGRASLDAAVLVDGLLEMARPVATRRMMTSGLMHWLEEIVGKRRYTEDGTTYHNLAQDGQYEILYVAVSCVRDDHDKTGDGVRDRGLDEHCRNGDVRGCMLFTQGIAGLATHVEKTSDEENSENDVQRYRDGEVRQCELNGCSGPERRVGTRRLKNRHNGHSWV